LPPVPGWRAESYEVEPAPATRLVSEGDILDLGDRHFEVLHLPGHSPGSIGLWEERTGILFSGDAIYDGELIDDAYHSDLEAYIRTICRLREMPATVVHGGHFPSFGRERLRALAQAFLDAKGVG
jgi:glyoxylase-like metal-dependent hydrolase (beta-lactamase superfamily II)